MSSLLAVIWEQFTVRKIFGFRGPNLANYFDDLELAHVLPKLLQYVYARGECDNAVWVLADEFERLKTTARGPSPYEPEQHLYRELKLQAVKPVGDEALAAHFVNIETQNQTAPTALVDGRAYILLPIQDVKTHRVLGYIFLMGVRPQRVERVKKRLMRDLGYMEKHIGFSLTHWQAQKLAFLDDLTTLYNQKYMSLVLENEIHRAQREKSKFSVLFMDVDYFKSVNDTRGHWVGSRLLVEVGRVLRAAIRRSDYPFRYGGDEFVVVLPDTEAIQAQVAAERIRSIIEKAEFMIDGETVKLTLSIGLATYPDHAKTYKDIIKMADEAMYCGKSKSRNIVFVAS